MPHEFSCYVCCFQFEFNKVPSMFYEIQNLVRWKFIIELVPVVLGIMYTTCSMSHDSWAMSFGQLSTQYKLYYRQLLVCRLYTDIAGYSALEMN